MKIFPNKAPQGAADIIRDALEIIHSGNLCPVPLRALRLDQFLIGVPHPVYHLDLGKGGALDPDHLRCDGYRFLIKAEDEVVATASVTTGPDGSVAGELGAISFGPRAAAFAKAIAAAEHLPGGGEMTPALINVAPLHLHGLLLLPKKPGPQRLVVVVDAPNGLALPAALGLQEFCKALAPAAAAFVAAAAKSPKALG